MNKKNLTIVISSLACVLSVVAIILVLNTNHFSFTNNTKNNDSLEKDTSKNDTKVDTDNKVDNTQNDNNNDVSNQDTQKTTDSKPVSTPVPTPTPTPVSTPVPTPVPTSTPTKSENDVVNYFNNLSNSISSRKSEDDTTLREKIKTGFVTVVDFIFYDGEIKGYKFSELTDTAKLKILEIATAIDSKIDEYFPNYKDTIKDKYTDLKGKLAVKYLEYTAKICETVGEETCNEAKEGFNNLKEKFGIAWEFTKELFKSGTSKLSEFYLNWRDK